MEMQTCQESLLDLGLAWLLSIDNSEEEVCVVKCLFSFKSMPKEHTCHHSMSTTSTSFASFGSIEIYSSTSNNKPCVPATGHY